ncbi:DUF6011 domain-containing protein [Mycobacterium marinum]|nr:DUF6011 domain-containing protein [Mycobacterium marinum]MDC9012048.1 DUF6011 domain-containing protein [Mycobacterium marinum]
MSPGSEAGAPSTTPIADTDITPLTADVRADIAILNAAAERGFRLAVRCARCSQWLVAPASVRRHLGPVCATRVAADEGVA